MPVFLLSKSELTFPHPSLASPRGILAMGGDLSPERLLLAYRRGIFPWFNEGEDILWWSPDPRFVLFPEELRVSKSMRPYFNQHKFTISLDTDFRAVMEACRSTPRSGQLGGTWITRDMVAAYQKLHELGFAHSVEVRKNGEMVGGLYGISLGKVFFGESMFTRVSNASKFGFIWLVRRLREEGFRLIDCQQATRHLASLGARGIARSLFLELLEQNETEPTLRGNWNELLNS